MTNVNQTSFNERIQLNGGSFYLKKKQRLTIFLVKHGLLFLL